MADVVAPAGLIGERYNFLIRRLHSLSGIIPVGTFLCIHLSINATIMAGPDAFQFAVDQIHKLERLGILKAVELLFILVPIAFHAVVGFLIWLTGSQSLLRYRYCGNLRYTLQRWTGIVTIIFILVHVWHVHWIIPGGVEFDDHAVAASTITAMQAWWSAPAYTIGVICAVFHLANGIWTFLITWGVTIGPKSQTRSAWVCAVIGIVIGLFGLGALATLQTMDMPASEPAAVEGTHHGARLTVAEDIHS